MTESRCYLEMLLKDKANSDNRDYSHFHPSEIGGCPRSNVFKILDIESSDRLEPSTLIKFDNGHSVHDRVQKYFRDINKINPNVGLVSDIVKSIEFKESKVSFKFDKNNNKIYNKKYFVYGESGRVYPYNPHHKIWMKDKHNSIKLPSELVHGDVIFLAEIPFENEELHMSGHVDGLIMENGRECVLEIKSINAKSFTRLFYNNDLKIDYHTDMLDDRKCHICGKSTRTGENMAMHLMTNHSELANPQKKHIIQGNAYMDALGADRVLFWYENKDNQEICDIIEYIDEKITKEIKISCIQMWKMIESTWSGQPQVPAMPKWAKSDAFGCKYCDFHHVCWKNDSPTIYKAIENMIQTHQTRGEDD